MADIPCKPWSVLPVDKTGAYPGHRLIFRDKDPKGLVGQVEEVPHARLPKILEQRPDIFCPFKDRLCQKFWYKGIEREVGEEDVPVPTLVLFKDSREYQWEWRDQGRLHREDGPAIEGSDGRTEWWWYGMRHRADGPALGSRYFLYDMLVPKKVHQLREMALLKKRPPQSSVSDWESLGRGKAACAEAWLHGVFRWEGEEFGVEERFKDGRLQDGKSALPAVRWFRHGETLFSRQHRLGWTHASYEIMRNPPAVIHPLVEEYWVDGRRSRLDYPAVVPHKAPAKYKQYWYRGVSYPRAQFKKNTPELKHKDGVSTYYFQGKEHREDGPSMYDSKTGSFEYRQHGLLHREGGKPALVMRDDQGRVLEQRWSVGGKLHRVGGPAVKTPTHEEWWVDGKLHRDGAPAIQSDEDGFCWYFKGQLHRAGDLPAVIQNDTQEWWENGVRHRAFGAALQKRTYDQNGVLVWEQTQYWVNGKLHRRDGPAVVENDSREWWIDGKRHREGGPAVEGKRTEYWVNGLRHREDGPAVIDEDGQEYWYKQGFPLASPVKTVKKKKSGHTITTYTLDGNLHREDGPALVDTAKGLEEWWLHGKRHRVGGPAFRKGEVEQYWFEGMLHREDGPAVKDGDLEEWYYQGQLHREGGPAQIFPGGEAWYWKGYLHRDVGPAYVVRDEKEWWIFGKLHNDEGPAAIKPWGQVFYLNGVSMSREEHEKNRAHVVVNNGLTVWRNAEGKIYRAWGPAVISPQRWLWFTSGSGKAHREDGPAIIDKGPKGFTEPMREEWIFEGLRHRKDGPAVVFPGGEEWWVDGKLHRVDGPALVRERSQRWFVEGKELSYIKFRSLYSERVDVPPDEHSDVSVYWRDGCGLYHREGGPAIIFTDGGQQWWRHGKLHREDGPAHETSAVKKWYFDGSLHREDGPAVEHLNYNEWRKHGRLHREDGPARVFLDQNHEEWYIDGLLHREDGPAKIRPDSEEWYWRGIRHRLDGPARITSAGETWYYLGNLHREDGPARIDKINGELSWFRHGVLHREGGPAIEGSREEWWILGQLHREDGPAKCGRYFLNNVEIPEDVFPIVLASIRQLKPTPVPRQSSPATRAGKLVAAKAGMDVLLGVIQAALGIQNETWKDPLFQIVLRAGIPVLLHSQSQDKAFQEWMEACLEAAMLQGGLKCVDKIREALSTVEVQSAVKAFVSEE